jgi:flagellar hook-basal body complex protein FliE
MTSPIGALSMGIGIPTFPGVAAPSGVAETAGPAATATVANDGGFADILTGTVDRLNGVQATADGLATQAATGDLQDAHDYMIASTEARLATDTVVTLKNSAVAAFTEIMRMPV